MKILSVGSNINHPEVTNASFKSNTSFLGFDLVIWNPGSVIEGYERNPLHHYYKGFALLSDNGKTDLKNDIERRHYEIRKLLEIGKTIVIILPTPDQCYYIISQTRSTGRVNNYDSSAFLG